MLSEKDIQEEALLDARIELGNLVFAENSNVPAKYCLYIKSVAKKFNVTESDLAADFFRHYGVSFLE
jgi:hypothetical protein